MNIFDLNHCQTLEAPESGEFEVDKTTKVQGFDLNWEYLCFMLATEPHAKYSSLNH